VQDKEGVTMADGMIYFPANTQGQKSQPGVGRERIPSRPKMYYSG
jgi:hypothetical protein